VLVIVILEGRIGITSSFAWYIIMPIGIYVIYPDKKLTQWIIYIVFLVILSSVLSYVFGNKSFFKEDLPHFSHLYLILLNAVTVSFALVLVCLFLYYLHKIQEIRDLILIESARSSNEDTSSSVMKDIIEPRQRILYEQIIEYFETEKPYLNKDFNIAQLAIALNTNIAYISQAIKTNKETHFNHFVNEYRIKMIKEMILNNYGKYTLEYIYDTSGFRNQSTFNKTFKQIEGITPSEYCRSIEKEKAAQKGKKRTAFLNPHP
jgi:AraC-like DNA-binding protein